MTHAIEKLRAEVMELPTKLGPGVELVGFVLVGVAQNLFDGSPVVFRSSSLPHDGEESARVLELLRDGLEEPIEAGE